MASVVIFALLCVVGGLVWDHVHLVKQIKNARVDRDIAQTGLNKSTRDLLESERKYEALVLKLSEKALTPKAVETQTKRIRAGSYSGIRKAVEAQNRQDEQITAAREADTAFQEN